MLNACKIYLHSFIYVVLAGQQDWYELIQSCNIVIFQKHVIWLWWPHVSGVCSKSPELPASSYQGRTFTACLSL